MNAEFDFEQLVELCERTHEESRRSAARAIDRSLVARNWLFGRYIVEYEQRGADRAEYGRALIANLANQLNLRGIKGCSRTSLWTLCEFYRAYPNIPQTLSEELAKRFTLGWSHYVALLSIDDAEARKFYEIEAAENGWSVRELRRQVDSSLYQRLALSRDKQELRRLACKGQMVEKPSDLIKNPYVLEFVGLDERPAYSESDMEAAVINRQGIPSRPRADADVRELLRPPCKDRRGIANCRHPALRQQERCRSGTHAAEGRQHLCL